MMTKQVIEIVAFKDGKVVQEVDVTRYSEKVKQYCERGMNINLNHKDYFTRQVNKEARE